MNKLALAALVGACWAADTAHAANPARGETLFNTMCKVCHGPNAHPGREVTRPAAYRPDVIADALRDVADMRVFAGLLTASDLDDLAGYFGAMFVLPPPAGSSVQAVEYHHAAFDHYFVTALPAEIEKLDRGEIVGWTRTGEALRVRPLSGADGTVPACRFFSASFAPKSSHFYTALPEECARVRQNAQWTFEGEVFEVALPETNGTCPGGLVPVFRLYNDGQGGAPNHRFTASLAAREAMLARGWISEGAGALGTAMCTPRPA